MNRARLRNRMLPPLVTVGALLAVLATTAVVRHDWSASAAGRLPATPSGQVLVVQANLQESVRPADAADTTDLDTFARRLLTSVPSAPDVLLLTDVLGPGARHLAATLGHATGHRYRAEVAGGRSAFLADGSVRETAILVNTDTVRPTGPGRYHRVQDEDQAYLAAQRRGGPKLALLSGHPAGDPATATTAFESLMDGAAAGTVSVVGGDFRDGRCAVLSTDQAIGCDPRAFWSDLTEAHGYEDAAYDATDAQAKNLSNYLFARADVRRAFVDTAYDTDLPDRATCKAAFDAGRPGSASARCRSTYYSDSPFTWAVLTAGRTAQHTVIPGALALDHCQLATRTADVVARVVNNGDATTTTPVTAEADAPLTVTPDSATAEVPAGQARNVVLKVTAPRADTPTGSYHLTVHIGSDSREVPVTVPEGCVEPKAYATSFHPGRPPEDAVDGDINTFWHSEYQPVTPLPQSITVNLGETKSVSALHYQPRFDGNLNGTILAYNVYVSTDGATFTKVATGTWAPDARLKTATFPATDARYVRLEGTKGNGGEFISAAEVTVD